MTSRGNPLHDALDDAHGSPALPADHAGSTLCRLLAAHPEVLDIEVLGQSELPGGVISYSLGVLLPGGRELFVDVEDA
ncbi:MAG TPA: hypothetical protein VFV41_17330 [Streptosporangiaceae bacterium]|nr:hypothetical protein [Streptosporangiaceae bacterium]